MGEDEAPPKFVIVLKEDITNPNPIVSNISNAIGEAVEEPFIKVISRLHLHWKDLQDAELVFSVGGDGTMLRTTHYMRMGKIVGIHASDSKSKGHFMSYDHDEKLDNVIAYLKSSKDIDSTNKFFTRLPRLKAEINQATGDVLTCNRAVNDYYIGNDVAGHPSKYLLTLPLCQPAYQRSSGVICSTFQGMTGWVVNLFRNRMDQYEKIRDEYLQKHKNLSSEFFYVVSQPMDDTKYEYGFTNQLTITSEMVGGVVALDGFTRINFDRKDEVDVRLSSHPVWVLKTKNHEEWA